MPALSTISADPSVRMMVLGDPGTGKTGSLVSLVKAGYRLFILNFEGDAHLAPLRNFLTPEEQERVIVATLRDDLKLEGKFFMPRTPPTAFMKGMQLLDKWKEGDEDYGSVYDWGPQDVLVVDSLTSLGAAAMNHQLHTAGRFAAVKMGRAKSLKRQKDWGEAMEKQELLLEALRSSNIRCNVVVIAHLTLLSGDDNGDDDEETDEDGVVKSTSTVVRSAIDYKRYPSALGKKLPPKIPGMFAAVVEAEVQGSGNVARRVLRTTPKPDVDIKIPALGLPQTLPIETGLATIFAKLKGNNEKPPKKAAA